MAAPKNNQNAVGNRGASLNDRKLAARVRNLALGKMAELLEMPMVKMTPADYELYKSILIRLAGSVLPRLAEVTGQDGEPVEIRLSDEDKNKLDALLGVKLEGKKPEVAEAPKNAEAAGQIEAVKTVQAPATTAQVKDVGAEKK